MLIEASIHLTAGLNQIWICYSLPAQTLMDEVRNLNFTKLPSFEQVTDILELGKFDCSCVSSQTISDLVE